MPYTQKDRLRGYSSIFSRSVFTNVLKYNDFTRFNNLINRYDINYNFSTYLDYIKYVYKCIAEDYRCEYVYKNETINQILIGQLGTKDAIAINEFRVKDSIVDIALFNGESRAYEIKTEYDNEKRLAHQLENYCKLFQKCYVIVPEELYQKYEGLVPPNIGIVVLYKMKRKILLEERKEAVSNNAIDSKILMHSLRTQEYKNIIKECKGDLPNVSCFEMFDRCEAIMKDIKQEKLSACFLKEIKKRTSCTHLLRMLPKEIRLICLAMNFNKKQLDSLQQKLNNIIN